MLEPSNPPPCRICLQLTRSGAQVYLPWWRKWLWKLGVGRSVQGIPPGTVEVAISAVRNQLGGWRSNKTIYLCGRHYRMLLRALDTLLDDHIE